MRRKKCDESRPFCTRCLSSGRKCEGYTHVKLREHDASNSQDWSWEASAQHPVWIATARSDNSRQKTSLYQRSCNCPSHWTVQHTLACLARCPLYVTNPSPLRLDSELEYTCFDYFRLRTGPGFAGYYDSSVWSALIIEACFTEPIVLQAVAAIGAVSYRYQLGITPEAFQFCETADRLYHTALRNWKREVAKGSYAHRPEITMVLGKLFASFETFQDNPESAANYLTYAFHQILNQSLTPISIKEEPINIPFNLKSLNQYFLKLEHQAAILFNQPTNRTWPTYPPNFRISQSFTTIEEARDSLFAETAQIRQIRLPHTTTSSNTASIQSLQRHHLHRLMTWSASNASYAQSHRPTNDPLLRRIGRLLKWYREAAFLQLLLLSHSSNGDEAAAPSGALEAHFARLVILSDGLLDPSVPFATSALWYPSPDASTDSVKLAAFRSSEMRIGG